MIRRALAALALVLATAGTLLSAPSPARAQSQAELYRPLHRTPAELAPLVAPLLRPEGDAVADPGSGSLLLLGPAAARARARAALARLDVAVAEYLVESRLESREALRLRGFAFEGWLDLGPLRVSRASAPEPAGGRVVFRELRSDHRDAFGGRVMVREGGSAELWTGRAIPARVRSFEVEGPLGGEARLLETGALLPVDTGFQVRPRGLPGGAIELEVAPVTSELGPDGQLRRSAASTRVALQPGEWLAVGHVARQTADRERGLGSLAIEGTDLDQVMLVRVSPHVSAAEPVRSP